MSNTTNNIAKLKHQVFLTDFIPHNILSGLASGTDTTDIGPYICVAPATDLIERVL